MYGMCLTFKNWTENLKHYYRKWSLKKKIMKLRNDVKTDVKQKDGVIGNTSIRNYNAVSMHCKTTSIKYVMRMKTDSCAKTNHHIENYRLLLMYLHFNMDPEHKSISITVTIITT